MYRVVLLRLFAGFQICLLFVIEIGKRRGFFFFLFFQTRCNVSALSALEASLLCRRSTVGECLRDREDIANGWVSRRGRWIKVNRVNGEGVGASDDCGGDG